MSNTGIHFEQCENLKTNYAMLLRRSQIYKELNPEKVSLTFTHCDTVELNPGGFYLDIFKPFVSKNMEQYQCDTEQQLEVISFALPCLAFPPFYSHS